MAVLTNEQRVGVWAEVMRGDTVAFASLTKEELKAAVDATDSWIDSNAASFNSALPNPARAQLTPRQKAMLLTYVVDKRWRVS